MPMSLEQRAERAKLLGCGSSEAAAALGVSRYQTPLGLYQIKVEPPEDNDAGPMARFGNTLESAILDYYEAETGRKGDRSQELVVSPKYPWMFAHFDWRDPGKLVVDAKLHGGVDYGDPGTDQVPQEVLCQLHHQMIVAEVDVGEIAAFILKSIGKGRTILEFATYVVPYNEKLGAAIIEAEYELIERVKRKEPPPPTDPADLVRLWTRASDREVIASVEVEAAVARLREVKDGVKVLSEEQERLEIEIKNAMQDASVLRSASGNKLASWAQVKDGVRLDTNKVRSLHPDVFAECSETRPGGRRFLLASVK